jgi:hypothetical protein
MKGVMMNGLEGDLIEIREEGEDYGTMWMVMMECRAWVGGLILLISQQRLLSLGRILGVSGWLIWVLMTGDRGLWRYLYVDIYVYV